MMQDEKRPRKDLTVAIPRKLLWALKHEAWRRQTTVKKLVTSVLSEALPRLKAEPCENQMLDPSEGFSE